MFFFLSFSKQHSTDRVTLITNNFSSSPVSCREFLPKRQKECFRSRRPCPLDIYQLRTKRFIWTYINRCHLNTILVAFSCFHFNLYLYHARFLLRGITTLFQDLSQNLWACFSLLRDKHYLPNENIVHLFWKLFLLAGLLPEFGIDTGV